MTTVFVVLSAVIGIFAAGWLVVGWVNQLIQFLLHRKER